MPSDSIAPNDDLRQKILGFEIDEGVPELSFRDRLARENGWTREYAQRVIDEYLRFVYLAMASGHVVTPSDQVDQAWHLHLTYTRSYWDRMCGEVLKRPLHHGPTRGGTAESAKYDDHYAQTIKSYTRLFGHSPPADIWPPAKIRFGSDLSHVRVNTSRHWVVPKPKPSRFLTVSNVVFSLCLMVFLIAFLGRIYLNYFSHPPIPPWAIQDPIPQAPTVVSPVDEPLIATLALLLSLLVSLLVLKRFYEHIIENAEGKSDTIDTGDCDLRSEALSLHPVQIARLCGDDLRCLEVALAELTVRGLCRVSDCNQSFLPANLRRNAADLSKGSTSCSISSSQTDCTGEAYELSALSMATMKFLPIAISDRLEKLKKTAAFVEANRKMTDELTRRKLIPSRNAWLKGVKFYLKSVCVVVLFYSLGSLALSVAGAAHSEALVDKLDILFVMPLVVPLVWQAVKFSRQIKRDLKATRRGQAAVQMIKNQIDDRISKVDVLTSVAVQGAPGLTYCEHPELNRLYRWFMARNAYQIELANTFTGAC